MVSNLPTDVNETQIRVSFIFEAFCRPSSSPSRLQELFTTTVGPLRDVTLHYDSRGVSKGVASVTFNRKGDGSKAYQQYNNRLIDGS